MKLKLISSLILTGLLLTSFGTPVKAGIFNKIKNTVQDVADPGGHIRGTVRSVTDKTQASVKICNRVRTQGGSLSFSINGSDFTLSHGYCQKYTAVGKANISFYKHSYTVGDGNYYFAADSKGYADLFSE